MAVQYRMYKSKNRQNSSFNKWFARAVWMNTVTIDDLATKIEQRCTLTRADILAVIAELKVVMKEELQNSNRVKIGDLGTFKLGISCKPSDTIEDFSAVRNVKDVHVLFQPEVKIFAGMRVKPLLEGVTVKELPKNDIPSEDAPDEGGDSSDDENA